LPERGFEEAVAAGVNLFFWEPDYRAQSRFWRLMPPSQREKLHVVAGTFAATAADVRADLDQARLALGLDRLAAFLVFWVRSPGRFVPEVLDELARLREAGAVGGVGISTHQRSAAKRAILDGFDVVMLRHNFIHSGAEAEVLPLAAGRGTGVLVFSACCQGVTLKEGVSAADSYRYALAQPGVSACWTAPRDAAELRQNLDVLRDPALTAERLAELRAVGAAAYPVHRAFLDGVRGR
jgi:aryl-alcohol dehydrogenase-like predicted oxidoreductase